jgi:hypothetical protein
MNLRREATKTIWKTVVFAGAMLGTAACHKSKPATTQPTSAVTDEKTAADGTTPNANPCADANANPCGDGATDPCADPCADRVRGVGDEGDVGRGFVLS